MEHNPYGEAKSSSVVQEISSFLKPENLLLCLNLTATCPYPKPNWSNSQTQLISLR